MSDLLDKEPDVALVEQDNVRALEPDVALVEQDNVRAFLANFKPSTPDPSRQHPVPASIQLACAGGGGDGDGGGGNLPPHLQRLILAHLPALKLMHLQATCPSLWKPLLQSSTLKDTWVQVRLRGGRNTREISDVWVMKSTAPINGATPTLVAYIPDQEKYYLFLPLLFSPYVSPARAIALHNTMNALPDKSGCVGASGPWIAFERGSMRPLGIQLDVYNTPTGHVISLPMLRLAGLSLWPSSAPTIFTDSHDQESSFCITVETHVEEDTLPRHHFYTLLVYDSAAHYKTWTRHRMCDAVSAPHATLASALALRGNFFKYFPMSKELFVWHRNPPQSWSIEVGFDDSFATILSLENMDMEGNLVVRCGQHLLLVTATVENEENGFSVWKLILSRRRRWEWEKIARTPPHLKWKSFSSFHPTFMVDDTRICGMPSASEEYMPSLVYDVALDTWYHLPGLLKNVQALCATKLSFTMAEH